MVGRILFCFQPLVSVTWLLSISTVAVLLLAFWFPPAYGGALTSLAQNISYGTLRHMAWGLALAGGVYMCVHGYGGERETGEELTNSQKK